ncbi:hypothetical protein CYMTET_7792 [Cymbomonas tetramitiformis]|uniref:Homoserine dehydrogenase n=1 Tax=Cymbomonas tetramitiformis TaxID=36881 RepID=A0AAE0LH39_9CHLO|nr:hypothetical protein CYMTET_7792 [Cymbomonas tetramitiformis]
MEAGRSKLIVVGCGGVGLALLEQIALLEKQDKHSVAVVAVIDSKHALCSGIPEGRQLTADTLYEIISCKRQGKDLGSVKRVDRGEFNFHENGAEMLKTLVNSCEEFRHSRLIFADCTASDSTAAVLLEAVQNGAGIALANKKPITGPYDVYTALTQQGKSFRAESTCGAGMPLIATVTRLVRSGDKISKMAGALSGTLGYVMSGLEDGKAFSQVVREAKAAGYTEPDPRDDLSGTDVARKALILARLQGWRLELADVTVESLFPTEMGPDSMPLNNFMNEGLLALDAPIAKRVEEAAASDGALRYAATVQDGKCTVGLVVVPKQSALGQLRGTDNLLEVCSGCYNPNPLVLQGRGAGTETTASGILADILELDDCLPPVPEPEPEPACDNCFYGFVL